MRSRFGGRQPGVVPGVCGLLAACGDDAVSGTGDETETGTATDPDPTAATTPGTTSASTTDETSDTTPDTTGETDGDPADVIPPPGGVRRLLAHQYVASIGYLLGPEAA